MHICIYIAELYDTEKPRFQRVHVEHSHKLNLLLLHRLLRHDIVGAAKVVQTLAGFYHNNPGAVRKVGCAASLFCIVYWRTDLVWFLAPWFPSGVSNFILDQKIDWV